MVKVNKPEPINYFGFRISNFELKISIRNLQSAIRNGYLLAGTLFLCLASCKKDEVIHSAGPYYQYAPTDTGRWILYDVDSTYYSLVTNPPATNFRFQVLERIDSTYIDGQGRPTQRLERFRRDSVGAPWIATVNAWNSTLTLSDYERVEDNVRFVKLGFPIISGKSWDGNAYNVFGDDEYTYDAVHSQYTLGAFNFDSTLTVLRGEEPNLIERKDGKEIFANHVGMIYKEYYDLDIQNFTDTAGTKYFYTMTAYGTHNAPVPIP